MNSQERLASGTYALVLLALLIAALTVFRAPVGNANKRPSNSAPQPSKNAGQH